MTEGKGEGGRASEWAHLIRAKNDPLARRGGDACGSKDTALRCAYLSALCCVKLAPLPLVLKMNILHLTIIHALSPFCLLQPFFVERAFRIFDRDKNGTVSMSEFIETMHQFAGQSTDEKLVFLFKVYDLDGE